MAPDQVLKLNFGHFSVRKCARAFVFAAKCAELNYLKDAAIAATLDLVLFELGSKNGFVGYGAIDPKCQVSVS